jgi:uncharacterized protein YktA (UPF0223 family)
VAHEVPFPRFGIQLPENQSADEFMDEVEKKVNAMIGESTMNEYKAFKNLVKHKKRINSVFSEVCGNKSFHSPRPGINKKAPAVAVASCSSRPPKISRRTSSNKRKGIVEGTSSTTVCLRGLDLLNLVNESISQLRLFRMLNFRLPLFLLNLVEKNEESREESCKCWSSANFFCL